MIKDLRKLNWFDATMIVSGAIVGAGIFMNSSESAKFLDSSAQLIVMWVVGGLIVFFTGFIYAELGAMFPRSGGEYVYLEEAFGARTGFMYGWTLITITQTGSLAAVAYTCASFISHFFPMSQIFIIFTAMAILWGLTGVNLLGVKLGSIVQNVFTVLKLIALALIIIYGLFIFEAPEGGFGGIAPKGFDMSSISLFGLALIPILFSYGGLHNLNFIAGEVKNPGKNLPLAIFLGVLLVMIFYVFVNMVYTNAMSIEEIGESKKLASDAMSIIAGEKGSIMVSLAIIVSTLGITNVMIMSGSRVIYAISSEQNIFRKASKLSTRYQVPFVALIAQSVWTSVFLFTNTYGQMLQYVIFGDAIFFVLITVALMRLRKIKPDIPRPYKTWGYPYIPILVIVIFSAITINLFVNSFTNSLIGLGIILVGIPVFNLSKKRSRKREAMA